MSFTMNKILSLLFDFVFIFLGGGILKDMVKVGGLNCVMRGEMSGSAQEKEPTRDEFRQSNSFKSQF